MKKYLLQNLELKDYIILTDWLSGWSRPRLALKNLKNHHKFFLKSYTKTPRELWVELFASKLGEKIPNFAQIQEVTLKKIPSDILDEFKKIYWWTEADLKPLGVLIDNAFPSSFEIKYGHRVVWKNPRDQISMKEVFDSIRKNYWFAKLQESLLQSYSDMIVFDALIGNMDRHLENWWILESDKFRWQLAMDPKIAFVQDEDVKFTPLFDHWSAWLFELSEEKVHMYLADLWVFREKYIFGRKYSLITADNGKPMNIFWTIEYQIQNSEWKKYLKKSILSISSLTLLDMAEVIFKMPEDKVWDNENRAAIEYSRERKELLLQSLYFRQQALLGLT